MALPTEVFSLPKTSAFLDATEFTCVSGGVVNLQSDKVYRPELGVLFTQNPSLISLRLKLILEEVEELQAAIKSENYDEVLDALGDIIYVCNGMGAAMGANMDWVGNVIHRSNMTKFCSSEEEAKETVAHIREAEPRYTAPTYQARTTPDGKTIWVVYDAEGPFKGKTLKSKYYTPVSFFTEANKR